MKSSRPLVVQKFGGSSVSDAEGIKRVAHRIVDTKKAGFDVAVVVSAMGDTTDDLIDLARQVSPNPPAREFDMLMTSGERIAMALLAIAITDLGVEARSFTGSQAGVITDSTHGKAKIINVTPGRIEAAINEGAVAIVAGFQGVSQKTKDITTLGRGGSDTTAVALAAALGAHVCEIYSDVDGVFTADPRLVPRARKVPWITYEEMLDLAAHGAKILHLRAVEYARRYDLPLHVRSSFSRLPGTIITETAQSAQQILRTLVNTPQELGAQLKVIEGEIMEQPIISGVAHDLNESKITVVGVPDRPGEAASIFQTLAEADINIDMIVQNVSMEATGLTDITFTCGMGDVPAAVAALKERQDAIGFEQLLQDEQIAKVSLVGAGMRTNPGVSARFFNAIAGAGVNVELISTSEIRISVVIRAEQVKQAVTAIHEAFGLDGENEAVVYAGTGR